MKENCG